MSLSPLQVPVAALALPDAHATRRSTTLLQGQGASSRGCPCLRRCRRDVVRTWCVWLKTDSMTDTTSVEVVKWTRPSMPFSCCRHTTVAAPAMNPTIVACDSRSTMKPNLEPHSRLLTDNLATAYCTAFVLLFLTNYVLLLLLHWDGEPGAAEAYELS